ncbi:hypothetical protein [Paenisporosarcina sp. TG-14]|uniref:hypothetical protein n=1 Tax=Paenisporosarcina sp. TG-14 TaxID=1231057 RepID=UPI0002D67FD9|nr:hypothetical protein [Paenisporosarcina sp. TG-14]
MSLNREKEVYPDSRNTIVSLNGVQVWIDNKFDDEVLDDDIIESIENPEKTTTKNAAK